MARAFSLVELLAVLGIMAVLTLGGVGLWTLSVDGARRDQTKAQLASIASSLYATRALTGSYPAALPATLATFDPWGNPYRYATDGASVTLSSLGADGVTSSDDIVFEP
jgi:prepilin-type N-terminal cleavage/methylation domain-containing protein